MYYYWQKLQVDAAISSELIARYQGTLRWFVNSKIKQDLLKQGINRNFVNIMLGRDIL